jgi:hypothetical protein
MTTSKKETNAMTFSPELLNEIRAAKTVPDFDALLAKLDEQKTAAARQLQQAETARDNTIFSGGNVAKAEAAVVEAARHIATINATIEGATKRRAEAEEQEAADELALLRERAQVEADEYAEDTREVADAIARARTAFAKFFGSQVQLQRTIERLESSGVPARERPNVANIAGRAVGHVPVPNDGGHKSPAVAQLVRRVDTVLYDLLMGREVHDGRRRALGEGRFGETRGAKAQILGALRQQAS